MTGGRGGKSTLSQTIDTETSKSVDNFSVNSVNSANSAVNSIDNHKDSETEVDPVASDSSRGVDLNPSAWRHMEKLISKQVSITVEKQTRQINDRIDSLSSRIEGIRDTYETQINEIKQKLTDPDLKTDEGKDDTNSVGEGTNDVTDTNSTQDSSSNYSYQSEPLTVGYAAGSLVANEPMEGKDKYNVKLSRDGGDIWLIMTLVPKVFLNSVSYSLA